MGRADDAPPAVPIRTLADAHFLAGFEHFRAGRPADARREWSSCRELDAAHDFCEFGLSVLDAGAPRKGEPDAEAPPAELPVTAAAPAGLDAERLAQQSYLEGVIYYQKGDYEKAAACWRKVKQIGPKGLDAALNADAGLAKIEKLGIGKTPSSLKGAPEKKDEHEALQAYFTGLIHYQKGDFVRARVEWARTRALAPESSSVMSDVKLALEKLDRDEASTRRDAKK